MATITSTDTPAPLARPLAGRILPLVGVVLLGISLRHAVTGISPLLAAVNADIALGTAGSTVLGMLPTIAFGIAGFITPTIIRFTGLAQVAVLAMALGALSTVVRVFAHGPFVFLVFGAIALFGMGMGNVAGPPLVKRYFPDRQGTMMSVLVLMMQGGATIPAMLAVPVANVAGWRVAVGAWALLMIFAAMPWLATIVNDRGDHAEQAITAHPAPTSFGISKLIRNPVSIGAALFYGMAALNTYAMLAWMPTIFASLGMSRGQAATMYGIYTFLTLPMALISPIIADKLKNPFPFGALLSVVAAIGYMGIIFAPLSTAALWTFVAGIGGGAFPFAMTMFKRRTRTTQGSAAVTGFGMGCGYAFGTVGPLLGGLLSSLTGGWSVPLIVFSLTSIPMVIGAILLTRNWTFEDLGTVPAQKV